MQINQSPGGMYATQKSGNSGAGINEGESEYSEAFEDLSMSKSGFVGQAFNP